MPVPSSLGLGSAGCPERRHRSWSIRCSRHCEPLMKSPGSVRLRTTSWHDAQQGIRRAATRSLSPRGADPRGSSTGSICESVVHFPLQLWSVFVTLLVSIGPIETAAIFASLTKGTHRDNRESLAARAVAVAGVLLLLFAVGGNFLLPLLHVSMPAFQVAGGILLFLQALTLTFARSGLSSISEGEHREAEQPGDIA